MFKKHKKAWIIIISIIAVVGAIFVGAGMYFYNVAIVPGQKSFLSQKKNLTKTDPLYAQTKWYQNVKKQKWTMTSADDNLKLDANYIPAGHSKKTVIILHGYMNNKDTMGPYAAMFHQLGYNTLLPDARGHGDSQGNYVGYGWREKVDVRKWVQKVIQHNGKDSKIVIFGVSMGGATTMMTSGLKLPSQVKAFVEDCGYTNAKAEIEHEAQDLYNMPAFPRFPLVEILSGITRVRAGYFLGDASSVKQLAKNKRPMMFIHGSEDTFVPTSMVYENYKATKGPKELWIVKGAKHAKSFQTNPKEYQKKIGQFLNKYV
ncbi:alpha/beta hydrolase [Lactobacillus sp.]|uniref:alpha/beta hydrolase n=1 Tax=Lactobacillus sp. TaxID=1591 RepID=UPI0019997301|nr:alpha/beta hydrolase [Lactobacillus sp.]MBD5430311.1 alpha/beta hydrolase [Lactobacillus sp.]